MIQVACECSHDIPGVDRLPPHDHSPTRLLNDMIRLNPDAPNLDELIARHFAERDEVHIWVDWKEVARS